jgi:hypothetical protein
MKRILARYGFSVLSDTDGYERAKKLGVKGAAVDRFLRFLHVVTADFVPQP